MWTSFQTTKFRVKDLQKNIHPIGSCGVYALSRITGLKLTEIDKNTPKKGWWDDAAMLRFLRRHGFKCHEISPERLHEAKKQGHYYGGNINHLNVLLISQHTQEDQGSWAVVYDHKYYHGREVELFQGYELIVNPFWTGYVIEHPKWKTSEKQLAEAVRKHFLAITKLDDNVQLFNPYSAMWVKWPIKFKSEKERRALAKTD